MMLDTKTLGLRIRNFRKRSGMSQFELENAINASPGSLSRIENGDVNPTKETITNIAFTLGLNHRQKEYMGGSLSKPASKEEITSALSTLVPHFENGNVTGYLVDDRWRYIAMSESFAKILELSNEELKYINDYSCKKTIIQFMIDDKLGIRKLLQHDQFEKVLYDTLEYFYYEAGFMDDDEFIRETIVDVMNDPIASNFWNQISMKEAVPVSTMSGTAFFKLGLIQIAIDYSSELLVTNPRFQIIKYVPQSRIIRFLDKII